MTSVAVSTGDSGGGGGSSYRPRYRRSYRRTRYRRPARRRRRSRSYYKRKLGKTGYLKNFVLSKFALANLDPFSPECYGARIPDSNTHPSTALRVEDEIAMTTDAANGTSTIAFRPFLKSTSVAGTSGGASSWTWTAAYGGGTDSTRLTAVANNYALYRPVAHGIRLSAPTAPTSTTGFVHVCIYAENLNAATWSYPLNVAQMNNCMYYARYPLAELTQKSVTVVNKFLDCSSSLYLDPGQNQAQQDNNVTFQSERGWATIIVAVEGAPTSTKVLVVESVIHIESTPLASGVNTAAPAAPFNIGALEQVSRVAGQVPGSFVQGEEASYFQEALSAMGAGMHSALGDFVPRAAYSIGRYATNYALGGIMGVTTARLGSSRQGGILGNPRITY